jgi:predicted MFS family arabinose efflux permease
VQWLLPALGWRGLFWAVAGLLAVGMAVLALAVPRDEVTHSAGAGTRYAVIVRHPLFVAMAPLAFFLYGGMIAVQALWAGPWLTRVSGQTPGQAAEGLFLINLCMLITFAAWGLLMPRLVRAGWSAPRLMRWGIPPALLLLGANVLLGSDAGAWHWAAWCVACTAVSVSQPAVGAAFPAQQAGRALSAFNLIIFGGVFTVQWGVGLMVDGLQAAGLGEVDAFRGAMAVLGGCSLASYLWFLLRMRRLATDADNAR